MKKRILLVILLLAAAGCAGDSTVKSQVYQGACIAVEDEGKMLVLANSQPNLNPIKGDSATFDISKATVGLAPEPGNVIRVAFRAEGEKLVALKVMNITKQDLNQK